MISCQQYDYIEIVCLYRYPITLNLKSGEIIQATALDTQQNPDRKECIKVESEGKEQLIIMDDISSLEVNVDNPHFKRISFD